MSAKKVVVLFPYARYMMLNALRAATEAFHMSGAPAQTEASQKEKTASQTRVSDA
jgi:hypothetical protein